MIRERIVLPVALVGVGLVGAAGGIGAWEAVGSHNDSTVATAAPAVSNAVNPNGLTLIDLYRRAAPSVVELTVKQQTQNGFGFSQQSSATGSGFVVDNQGHIVTNAHVVSGADTASVRFANGDEAQARVVGTDPSTDVAVLELQSHRDVAPLPLGSSASIQVGQAVAAIGSPFGLEGTLTSGIVSGLDRDIRSPNGFTISGAIQTDTALNHGNSGGPLLDSSGRVLGITSQIESESGGNVGVGYAVPIDTVKKVVSQLLQGHQVQHAYLGVLLGQSRNGGVPLVQVRSGSPAASAGLKQGDVVTAVGGKRVSSPEDVQAAVEARQPGDTVELQVNRSGGTKTVTVTLAQRPKQAG
jgi:putative serine protease PepD